MCNVECDRLNQATEEILIKKNRERENILYLRDIHRKSHHDKENTAELIAHPIGVISA